MRKTTTLTGAAPLALLSFLAGCSASNDAAVPSDAAPPTTPAEDASAVATRDASDAGPPQDDAQIQDGSTDDANDTGSNDAGPDGAATSDAAMGDAEPSDAGVATEDASDGSGIADAKPPPVDSGPTGPGHVVFMMPSGQWTRMAATPGATRVDLETKLNAVSSGTDQWASLARDGASIVIVGSRFACAADDCVAIAASDGSTAAEATRGGAPIEAAARPAIASGAQTIVYPATGGPHSTDLYATTHSATGWSAPRLLTAASPGAYQHDVALSSDGARAVFVCGPSPYQVPKSSICEANVDGSGTRVVIANDAGPGSNANSMTHHPDFAPDGSIVFEADWGGSERIWRATGASYALVSPSGVSDDNSPCVLPDGRIASLWLGRPGNTNNFHELKVMNADGSGGTMLVTGVDITDVGESCGF